jgi:dCMP deaminase
MSRPPWAQYFMQLATQAATRGTCPRRQVGCVIVKDRRVIATGYNGSLSGTNHCSAAGCLMRDGHCIRAVHAEANAVAQAARHGPSIEGATAYVTTFPCLNCLKLLVQAGVYAIHYGAEYPHAETTDTTDMAAWAGILLTRVDSIEK